MIYNRLLTIDEVDNAIDEWHNNDSLDCALHEYLGWTWKEYSHWVVNQELPKKDKYKDL